MTESIVTANYEVTTNSCGKVVNFYCASSGMLVFHSPPLAAKTDEEAALTAWEDGGRMHFDKCGKCGRWVSSVMYNADVLACVDCSPWEEAPNYCPFCGKKVDKSDVFCPMCGKRLMYGGA